MKRDAKRFPSFESSNQLESVTGRQVVLYMDIRFEKHLMDLLLNRKIKRKFLMVAEYALSDRYNDDLYGHENISNATKDVTAIKICVLGNHRIYCKEFFAPGIKRIVMIKHVDKKTEKVSKDLIQLIKQIGGSEYEFEE